MANIGQAKTNKFPIGVAEVRVGPLSSANKLTQANSIGLVEDIVVDLGSTSTALKAGFPKRTVATAITESNSQITGKLREYSRRNLALLLNAGAVAAVTDVESRVVTNESAGSTAFDVTAASGANFAAGDLVTIYPLNNPEKVSICLIDGVATDTVTLDANTPLLHDCDGTSSTNPVVIFKAQPIAVGGNTRVNYFSVQVLYKDELGRPVGFTFWKGQVTSGMKLGINSSDYGSTDLNIELLEPVEADYATGADLDHAADLIALYPVGMYTGGGS